MLQSAGFLARGKTCFSCPWYSSQPHQPSTCLPPLPPRGEGTKVAEVEHTVPLPSPPTWAEMVRRGTTLPLGQPRTLEYYFFIPWGQPPSHTPPGPASRHSPLLSAHILQLYQDCVAKGIRAKLVFETRVGEEEYSFFCSPQPEAASTAAATTAAATAAATTAAAGCSHRQGKKKKRPPN